MALTLNNADAAFAKAIHEGRLCDRGAHPSPYKPHPPYADEYMYMGTFNGRDEFKHSVTRRYLDRGA